jgi:hypothetical protein
MGVWQEAKLTGNNFSLGFRNSHAQYLYLLSLVALKGELLLRGRNAERISEIAPVVRPLAA